MNENSSGMDQLDNMSSLFLTNDAENGPNPNNLTAVPTMDDLMSDLDSYEAEMERSLSETVSCQGDATMHKLFQSFQHAATSLARMFKEATNTNSRDRGWQAFQNTAGAITLLYKESLAASKVQHDLGLLVGSHRKQKELLAWLKKKKRRPIMRREEIIQHILGKTTNQTNTNTASNSRRSSSSINRQPQSHYHSTSNLHIDDLATFQSALTQQPTTSISRQPDDLEGFFCEQVSTHVEQKRTASTMLSSGNGNSMDVSMDSPTRKRPRFGNYKNDH